VESRKWKTADFVGCAQGTFCSGQRMSGYGNFPVGTRSHKRRSHRFHYCWDHSNDEFMRYLVLVFMIHKEEGGGTPQIKVDIQRRLIAT
jgi:hypothetical protein